MDQGSTRKRSAVQNFAPRVTKFCVMWEGQALPHDTKFGNGRCEIVGRRVIFIWPLIHGSSWSGLIKAEPGVRHFGIPIFVLVLHWFRFTAIWKVTQYGFTCPYLASLIRVQLLACRLFGRDWKNGVMFTNLEFLSFQQTAAIQNHSYKERGES